jgi:hypothetical protein
MRAMGFSSDATAPEAIRQSTRQRARSIQIRSPFRTFADPLQLSRDSNPGTRRGV